MQVNTDQIPRKHSVITAERLLPLESIVRMFLAKQHWKPNYQSPNELAVGDFLCLNRLNIKSHM